MPEANPRMSGAGRPIWCAADPGDPLAGAILAALPASRTRAIACPGDLPAIWPKVGREAPRVVVVHRAHLGGTDRGRLARLRQKLGPDRRVILCVGPHARYADVERWLLLVDLVLPEAAAAETIAWHVGLAAPSPRTRAAAGRGVAVVSTGPALRGTWGAILRAVGHDPSEHDRLEAVPPGCAVVWDVPVLEPDWPARLAARAALGPVVAAIGFLDRATRDQARRAGAVACLDLPGDLADLVLAVDRATGNRRDPAQPAVLGPKRSVAPDGTRIKPA